MVSPLRVRLIGPFEVDGLTPHAVGSRKARTLLKLLTLGRGNAVSVDVIVDALWPNGAPARPADQVSVLVSRLRGVVGADRLRHHDAGYSLHCDWSDLVEFEARADDAVGRLHAKGYGGASAAALAALQLVRGPLLPDEDGEWADRERVRFDRTLARIRLVAAEALLERGQALEAAVQAEDALVHDPYDEHALRLLMRAHVDAGRPASALARYAQTRTVLAEELGVNPSAETERLHSSILMLGEDEAPPRPLAAPQPKVVGRDRELADLDALLRGETRAVVVQGEAGIGKSALVNAWLDGVEADRTLALVGNCDELGRDLSLQPVLDALTSYVRGLASADVTAVLGPHLELIGPLVGLGHESVKPDDARPTTFTDRAAGRSALFASLLDVIERAAGERLVVVVVEDLHWAGESTLAWLRFAMRRSRRVRVLVTSRTAKVSPIPDAAVLSLSPLDREAAAIMVGRERIDELYARSNGNPLFLLQLAAHDADDLPPSIVETMRARLAPLGPAGASLRAAAVIGMDIDVDLIAAATDLSAVDVLDHLDLGVQASVLREQGTGLSFVHELVREAIAADMNAPRRAHTHRQVARALLGRSRRDPIAVAFHARLGGEIDVAVRALHEASMLAFDRHDVDQADQLLSDALSLADSADLRLARARVRMARSLHDEAAIDAAAAIAFAPSAEAFELAGWIAYYRRDYALAARLAEDAARHATDRALETSALALAGRVRHSHGELNEAEQLLQRASRDAPQPVQRLADVWLGGLRVHQGRARDALEAVDRGLVAGLDLGHPFAPIHALFAQTYAYAMLGSIDRAHQSLETMRAATRQAGEVGQRFWAVITNLESWLLRATGRYDLAEDASRRALELTVGTLGEPVSHAHLDLAEVALRRGDVDEARTHVELTDQRVADHHTMAWHQRERVLLLRSRYAHAAGDLDTATACAQQLAVDAEQRGSRRYLVLAQLQRATLAAAARRPLDADAVAAIVRDLGTVAGVDAWMLTADLAVASADDRWWRAAELAADTFAAAAARDPRTDVTALREFITREFTRRRSVTPARTRRRR